MGAELLNQLGRLLETISADPNRALFGWLAVTAIAPIYWRPFRVLLRALALEANAIAGFWTTPPNLPLPGRPWGPTRTVQVFVGTLDPLVSRPVQALTSTLETMARNALQVLRWPVAGIVAPLAIPSSALAASTAQSLTTFRRQQALWWLAATSPMQSGRGLIETTIGAIIFAGAAVVFVAADYTVGIAVHDVIFRQEVAREVLQAQPLAFTTASVVAVATLGLVIGELTGFTHLSPWAAVRAPWKHVWTTLAVVLLLTAFATAISLAIWRADEIMLTGKLGQILDPEWRLRLLLFALSTPLVILVGTTLFALWGLIAILWLAALLVLGLIFALTGVGSLASGLVGAALQVLIAAAHGAIRLGGLVGIAAAMLPVAVSLGLVFSVGFAGVTLLASLTLLALVSWNIGYFLTKALLVIVAFIGRLSTPTVHVLAALYFIAAWPVLVMLRRWFGIKIRFP